MYRVMLVAPLLLTMNGGMAEAAENPEQKSKTSKYARASLVVLAQMGVNDQEVLEFVDYVDKKIDKGYLRIAENHVNGGKLSLSYKFSNKDNIPGNIKGPVVQFSPDDSNWQYTAGMRGAVIHYRFKF